MDDNKKKFNQLINECESVQNALEKKYSAISTLRVISFLAGIALLIIYIKDKIMLAGIVAGLFLLLFVVLVIIHKNVDVNRKLAESKMAVLKRYIARFDDGWRSFSDNGADYIKEQDTVSKDVDLLGENSLYQMITVCHTEHGKNIMAQALSMSCDVDSETIRKRQEAVKELIDKWDFSIDFESAGIRLEGKKKKFSSYKFEEYCEDDTKGALPGWAKAVSYILPAIEIVLILIWILGIVNYGLPLAGFVVLLSFSWITNSVTTEAIYPAYNMSYAIDDYIDMMSELEKHHFESELLCEKKSLICGDDGVMKAFAELKKIAQAYNISFNPVVHQVLSGLFLWDYQLARIVQSWKNKYGKKVKESFKTVGEIEFLLSLSTLGKVRAVNWSEISDDEEKPVFVECENIYHPLIPIETVVANSCNIDSGITIITGSNMSGKTTFLRTLAMNLVLAYVGGPVCGEKLRASRMKIFTSMRVTDDVANGISTFYAEILRIKEMAEYKKNKKPMICLVDEIFKGTNSADRIVGAKGVITGLADDYCMTIVSTHDFELCSIQDKNGCEADNYHFEEYYENEELKFDYKIKNGRCTTTNARVILKMAGFDVV